MLINQISDRSEFIDYVLRQLGHPLVNVNVEINQVQDRIDDALLMFYNYHMDGSERIHILHQITQTDIDNGYIPVPVNTITVTEIVPSTNITDISKNDLQAQSYFTDVISNGTKYGLSSYVITKSWLNTFRITMGIGINLITHNVVKNKLKIHWDWSNKLNTFVAYEAFVANDVDVAFNSYWLKQYATSLVRKQWANNLLKISGQTLPGGGTINADGMLSQANEEIETLEQRLKDEFSLTVMPFMG